MRSRLTYVVSGGFTFSRVDGPLRPPHLATVARYFTRSSRIAEPKHGVDVEKNMTRLKHGKARTERQPRSDRIIEPHGNDIHWSPSIKHEMSLNRKMNLKSRTRSLTEQRLGPLSPLASALKLTLSNMQADPVVELQKHIQQETADSDVIRVCLIAAWEELAKAPRAKRVDEVRRASLPIAATVLRHVWRQEHLWAPMVFADPDAVFALCSFALYEGLDDILLEWTRVDVSLQITGFDENPSPHTWRGSLLRAIMTAAITNATGYQANQALQMIFKVVAWKDAAIQQRSGDPAQHIDFRPAVVELSGALTCGSCGKTDSNLYERFQRLYERIVRSGRIDEWHRLNIARLTLYHPSQPDADLTLRYIRDLLSRYGTEYDPGPHMSDTFKKLFQYCHALLAAQKRSDEMTWVEKVYAVMFREDINTTQTVLQS